MKIYSLMVAILMGSVSTLNAITPEQLIADGKDTFTMGGQTVRKGTIASLIENASQLNILLKQEGSREKAIEAIKNLRESMPAQKAVNLFNVFPPEDWILGEERPGNIMVGVLYLQQFPESMTDAVKEQLRQVSLSAHPLLKTEIEKLI